MSDLRFQKEQFSDLEQAVLFNNRERRKSLAGIPEMHRTHRIVGASAIAVADIDIGQFPVRTTPITFRTVIEITLGTPTEHRGLIFELGDDTIGAAAWVGDQTIGFHAGEDGTVNGATALFDNTVELPVGLELDLTFAVIPGNGTVRAWGNGTELARSASSGGDFGTAGTWAAASNGSFAAVPQGTVILDVPVASRGAPAGFSVIEPLSVYVGQVPRHFV